MPREMSLPEDARRDAGYALIANLLLPERERADRIAFENGATARADAAPADCSDSEGPVWAVSPPGLSCAARSNGNLPCRFMESYYFVP